MNSPSPSARFSGEGISRRALLGSAVAAVSVSLFAPTTHAQAVATGNAQPIHVPAVALHGGSVESHTSVAFYDTSFALRTVWDVAQAIDLSCSDLTILRVAIEFDGRIFTVSDRLVLARAGVFHTVPPLSDSLAGHVRRMRFEVPLGASASDTIRILVPLRSSVAFPNDSVEGTHKPAISVDGIGFDGSVDNWSSSLLTHEVVEGVAPSALLLHSAWDVVSSSADGSLYYRAPLLSRVQNEGPYASSEGHVLQVRSDARYTGEPQFTDEASVALLAQHTVAGNERTSTVQLPAIASGEAIAWSIGWPEAVLPAHPSGAVSATAEILLDEHHANNRTGPEQLESVSARASSLRGTDIALGEEI
ncbi:MAG: hypothetical protein ACTHXV_09375 [Canibacter sp.]